MTTPSEQNDLRQLEAKIKGLPEEACFSVYPAPLQPILCGQGTGGPGPGEPLSR